MIFNVNCINLVSDSIWSDYIYFLYLFIYLYLYFLYIFIIWFLKIN